MTTETRNDAAEWLRNQWEPHEVVLFGDLLEAALETERRAMVKRIRAAMPSERHNHATSQDEEHGFNSALHSVLAILDEEAPG